MSRASKSKKTLKPKALKFNAQNKMFTSILRNFIKQLSKENKL